MVPKLKKIAKIGVVDGVSNFAPKIITIKIGRKTAAPSGGSFWNIDSYVLLKLLSHSRGINEMLLLQRSWAL